jgi:hypothetical protein
MNASPTTNRMRNEEKCNQLEKKDDDDGDRKE